MLCAYRGFGAVVAELDARHCVIEDLDVGDDVAVCGGLLERDELVGGEDGLCRDLEGCRGRLSVYRTQAGEPDISGKGNS